MIVRGKKCSKNFLSKDLLFLRLDVGVRHVGGHGRVLGGESGVELLHLGGEGLAPQAPKTLSSAERQPLLVVSSNLRDTTGKYSQNHFFFSSVITEARRA